MHCAWGGSIASIAPEIDCLWVNCLCVCVWGGGGGGNLTVIDGDEIWFDEYALSRQGVGGWGLQE